MAYGGLSASNDSAIYPRLHSRPPCSGIPHNTRRRTTISNLKGYHMSKAFSALTRFQSQESLLVRWTSGIAVAAFEFQGNNLRCWLGKE